MNILGERLGAGGLDRRQSVGEHRGENLDELPVAVVANTGIMTGAVVVLSIFFGGLLAVGLNRDFRGRSIARTLAITPFFLMPVAAALFWKTGLYDPTFGILGWLTNAVGIGRFNWISQYPRLSIIILTTWQWSAFALIILIAGLQ